MKSRVLFLALLFGAAARLTFAAALLRPVPAALPDHPGNIFLAGENVVMSLQGTGPWRLLDYEDRQIMTGQPTNGRLAFGALPVGFYRAQREGDSNWMSLAVLAPLKSASSLQSPVALDVAMAWFYPKEKMEAASSLCALAGVNWVRDRLSWGQMELRKGEWAGPNRYDQSAQAQSGAGLQVLQVNHSSPAWAGPSGQRFPPDLRDAYRFYREMARRWRGKVQAFEPWNEADISMFGGHTGSEMAALQKASYLGLKAGNPEIIACLNVFAMHNRPQLADLHDNEAWPYFDTFNLHHYASFDEYPRLYADFRAVSAGKPLWVSEFALPVKWSGNPTLQEPTVTDSRLLSERVVKAFACSLHEGSVASFYFLLPHYVEGQTQFGVLRPDLSPRPAYVALAAVGRLLADARPLGRLKSAPDTVHAHLFNARPDGQPREVLVGWTAQGATNLALPAPPIALFDHLGREVAASSQLRLSPAPVLAVLPEGSAGRLSLQPPPATPPLLAGTPSPIVLQASWPQDKTSLSQSAYRISSERPEVLSVLVYNFGEAPAHGTLNVTAPAGWLTIRLDPLELAPQSRTELHLELDCRKASSSAPTEAIRVTGNFGPAGRPVLSVRLMPEPSLLARKPGQPVPGAADPARWQPTISGNGTMTITAEAGAVLVEAAPQGGDRWAFPRLVLPATVHAPPGAIGLGCTIKLEEGQGQFRAIFDETNGSSYAADFVPPAKSGQAVAALALFEEARYGAGWSKPDPNGQLDPDQVVSFKIGCNTKAARVRFSIQNVRWLMR
jgi:hypothetical protein